MISSIRWPGSTTVSKNGKYCSIYVGDLTKTGGPMYSPMEPPMVNEDPSEADDHPFMKYIEKDVEAKAEGEAEAEAEEAQE